jgi:hypothetical protein
VTDSDRVVLIVVFTGGGFLRVPMSLAEASALTNLWLTQKEAAFGGDGDAERWLVKTATGVLEGGYTLAAVAWEGVAGMYVASAEDFQQKLASVQERFVQAIEKEAGRGDEWRGGED